MLSFKHFIHKSAPSIRVMDEKTNKPMWECLACGERFPYMDNSDLPKPRLTAPVDEDFLERWSNRSVVTKKNLTTPTIFDIVNEVLKE